LVKYFELDCPLNNKDESVAALPGPDNLSSLLYELLLHEVVDLFKKLIVKVRGVEVVDLLQEGLLELLPGIVVSLSLLLHFKEDIREAIAEVIEYFLGKPGESAVVRTFDCGRPGLLSQEGYLSEVFSLKHLLDVSIVLHVVLDPDFAVTLGNEIHAIPLLVLLDDHILGQVQQSGHVVDQKFYDILIPFEYRILENGILKNMLSDLEPQTWRDHVQKLV